MPLDSTRELLIAPRPEDRYPTCAGGSGTAAIARGESRAHIGAGAIGPNGQGGCNHSTQRQVNV